MKFLILLFFVGLVSSYTLYDVFEDAADEIHRDFLEGMDHAPSLKEVLRLEGDDALEADEVEKEVKTKLGEKLREALDHVVAKIKELVDHGMTVRDDLIHKFKELKDQLKDVRVEMSHKAKKILEDIKAKSKDLLKDLLEKLGINKDKRFVEEELEQAFADISIKNIFKKLKRALIDIIDKEKIKEKIEELFGKGSEMADTLIAMLKEKGNKGKQKILDFIDRVFEEKDKRSLKDSWEKVKEYFKDLHIQLKEKYMKFGEWVKNVIDKGLTHSKNKLDNLKNIAREFIDHSKGVSKEIAVEALEFLRPYKDDLGSLWKQLKDTVKEIVNKQD